MGMGEKVFRRTHIRMYGFWIVEARWSACKSWKLITIFMIMHKTMNHFTLFICHCIAYHNPRTKAQLMCSLLRCHKFPCCTLMKTMCCAVLCCVLCCAVYNSMHTSFIRFSHFCVNLRRKCFGFGVVWCGVAFHVCFWIVNSVSVSNARLALQFSNRSSRKISA